MNNTEHLDLKKPEYMDFADIQDMNDNMDAIDAAIHDTHNSTSSFTSFDVADERADAWSSIEPLASGETHGSILSKISQALKNLRFLWRMIGNTDISTIGNGTITNALSVLNANGVKTITRSGTTFTVTRNDNSSFTFTQQDNNTTYGLASTNANGLLRQLNGNTSYYMSGDGTWRIPPNTWRPIQNVLTSTSTTDSLSAAMGKSLKDQIGNLGPGAGASPFYKFVLPGGLYMIYGARIYSNISINQSYGNAYYYNFHCSFEGLVPNNVLMIQATANCNGGAYAVSIATSSKSECSGFVWAPSTESNRSIALNLFVICN